MAEVVGWTTVLRTGPMGLIERLWRSLKYECVYLQAFETGSQARTGIGSWIDYYNKSRSH